MAQGDSSDILMKFVVHGSPIAGESTTELDIPGKSRSKLFGGFVKRQMFEIDSFKFSVGIEDDTGSGGPAAAGGGRTAPGQHGARGAAATSTLTGGFQAWGSGRPHKKYPVNVNPITFTRPIDRSSPVLLQHCIKCTSFDSASLVKRKSAGSAAAGEPYLRMDFVGVLITQVDWSNDDPVKETCTFISRSITVRYRPQLPDGSLGIIRPGFWSMLPWEREFPL
jgi:type VI protein secretion system component Hcp